MTGPDVFRWLGFVLGFSRRLRLRRRPSFDFLFGDSSRIAVEVRVGKQAGRGAGVVDDVEPELAVVVADTACRGR